MAAIINQGGIAETPEALRVKRDADKRFEESGKKYEDDPSLAGKEQASIRESLGYGEFSVGTNESGSFEEQEEEGNPDDILAGLDDTDGNVVEASALIANDIISSDNDQAEKGIDTISERSSHENEHPLSPIINSFVPKGLSGPEAKDIKAGLIEGGELKDILKNSAIDANRAKSLTEALDYLEKPEVKQANKENFNTDYKEDIETLKVPGEDGKELTGITADTVDLLGSNYFVNLDQRADGNETLQKEEAINMAFERSANQIIDGVSIRRDEGFDLMMQAIKNPDLDFAERFKELKELNKEVSTGEGVKGIKDKKAGRKIQSRLTANDNARTEFIEAQNARTKAEAELHANDNKLQQSEALNSQPEETGGDIFTAGDLDTANASV